MSWAIGYDAMRGENNVSNSWRYHPRGNRPLAYLRDFHDGSFVADNPLRQVRTATLPLRTRLVTEAEVSKLHNALEWARRTYRPESGYLTDIPIPKLPPALRPLRRG